MRIVCLGDSLTSGMSQGDNQFPYGQQLQKLLDKECGKGKHEGITCGNNGETAVSMAKRHAVETESNERKRLPPKLFILLAGTNDLRAYPAIDEETIVDALAAMVAAADVAVVCTVPRMPTSEQRTPALTERRDKLNTLICERFSPRVVDTTPIEDALFDADGLYLTKAGYAALAKLVYPVCRAAMKRKKKPG